MMTVGEVATRLSMVTHQDSAVIARQLRGWLQNGTLKPTATEARGTTGVIVAAMFDEVALCKARLIMALAATSPGRGENELNRTLVQAEAGRTDPTAGRIDFEAAVAGTKRGENWVLELVIVRDFLTNRLGTSARWIVNGDRSGFSNVDPMLPTNEPIRGAVEAAIQFPFSKLVSPLVQSSDGSQ